MLRRSPLIILWLVAACTARGPTAPGAPEFTTSIMCQASVTARTVTCGSLHPTPPPGMGLEVTLGGQGTYVLLTSSGTAYDGSAIFSTNVTVQNLIVQPMNSADGTTADTGGVKVFFNTGPTVTGGTGTVTVANPTGTATFTASNQPFYRYSSGAALASGATSASKLWQFNCPSTVSTFDFTVFVTSKLPADESVLLWTPVSSPTTQTLRSVRVQSLSTFPLPTLSGWAVGDAGTILHYDGSTWSTVSTGLSLGSINLYGLDATGAGAVYAVGDAGTIVYSADTGKTWSLLSSPVSTALFSVGHVGGSGKHVFITGTGGVILHATDGVTFTQQTSGTSDSLFLTGGFADTIFFAGGQAGTGLRWNGSTWSAVSTGSGAALHAGAGTTDNMGVPTNIWLVGTAGTILQSTSPVGASWTAMTSNTSADLYGTTGESPTDLFAVGAGGTIQHLNDVAWSAMTSGSPATLRDITLDVAVSFSGAAIEYWAVGSGGTILHGTR